MNFRFFHFDYDFSQNLKVLSIAVLIFLTNCSATTSSPETGVTEILWDSYGVPHVYGADEASTFYGFGWAQTHSQGDLLLRLYGQARARGSEYWGEDYEDVDVWLLSNGVPERAQRWYSQQSKQFKANLDAFAGGINAYAEEHAENLDPDVLIVLPITGVDVVAHAHRLMNYVYVASPNRINDGNSTPPVAPEPNPGSNTWAVAPAKSTSGNTLLLQNPHLPWASGFFTYYEAHVTGPDFEMYGATQVGLPVIRFAFNQNMGISNTVNNMLGATTYLLTQEDDGYLFDGQKREFETQKISYKLKGGDGELRDVSFDLRSTVHGPVFETPNGNLLALRVSGLDRPKMLEQYFDMLQAKTFAEFEEIMSRNQVPTFNITYADKAGHIQYIDNGILPKRGDGDRAFWGAHVPGDSSEYVWDEIHSYAELPKVTDPGTGFVQNSNDPPWLATYPPTYSPDDFPAYIAPRGPMSLRAQQSVKMMAEKDSVSFDEFIEFKLSDYALMTERVLDDLLAAASSSTDSDILAATALLSGWDRRFTEDTKAGLLFEEWASLFAGGNFAGQDNYAERWSLEKPLTTPTGLKDAVAAVGMLKQAVANTIAKYGALDVRFGDVSRFDLDGKNIPGHGGYGNLGVFRVITWSALNEQGYRTPRHGETWVAMVEFSDPIKAYGLMSYGNSRQKNTENYSDQLDHLAADEFRPLLLQRSEIEAAAVETVSLNP
jgi:acyl-homoserine-lactone acylase